MCGTVLPGFLEDTLMINVVILKIMMIMIYNDDVDNDNYVDNNKESDLWNGEEVEAVWLKA